MTCNSGLKSLSVRKPEQSHIHDFYRRLVHDRIRMLEQKEKMLNKRTLCLPFPSHVCINKPLHYLDYFENFCQKNMYNCDKKSNNNLHDVSGISMVKNINLQELENEISRVEFKKKLLVQELLCAKSQTKKLPQEFSNVKIQTENLTRKFTNAETQTKRLPRKLLKTETQVKKLPQKLSNVETQTKKLPRELSNAETQTKKLPRETSNVKIQTKKLPRQLSNMKTQTEQPTRTFSDAETQTNLKCCSKANDLKKMSRCKKNTELRNWRKLFDNKEKLTESSYYSPPAKSNNFIIKKDDFVKNKENCPNGNIGYYIHKLLLMRRESVDNLDVSSCNTTTIDEFLENKNFADFHHDSKSDEINDLKNEDCVSLPSVEELLKQGLITKPLERNETYNGKSADETMEEEDFIKQMLKVNIEPLSKDVSIRKLASSENVEHSKNFTTSDDEILSTISDKVNKIIFHASEKSDVSSDDLRKELRILGLNWMNTTIQRTLKASVINSTSSADDSDVFRHVSSTST